VLTLRRKLEVYGESAMSEKERAAKLSKIHGLLSVAADVMNEVGLTTDAEALQTPLGFIQRIAAEPKVFDGRTIGSRRKRDEAATIANFLKVFKAVVREVKAVEWLDLEARIARYISGKKLEPESLHKRRQRARAT
jgi:hypothetical protein